MDQLLGAFGIDWKLLIAQAVNFGIVLVALWYFLYTPVLKVLEDRRKVVAKGVADAQEAAATLAEADSEVTKRLTSADMEAQEITQRAKAAAAQTKANLLKEAEERAAQIALNAKKRAEEDAKRVRAESERDIARLAILASEKLMKGKHD